jgi:acyl-CoA thioester hydrolase
MFTTRIVPRVSETDGAGHINNTVAPVWLEAGRKEIFRIFTADLGFASWRLALVNMNVDYVAQLYWQHEVEVRTWVDRVGTTSVRLYEEIWQRDTPCVRASATYVCFDYASQAPAPVAAAQREQLLLHARP